MKTTRLLPVLATLLLAGCAVGAGGYPGRADVRAGAAPVIRIEPTNSTETSPHTLRVPLGTTVSWVNASGEQVFIRFQQPVEQTCAEPVGFHRTYDRASFASAYLPPFAPAQLCLGRPGRYDFIVASEGRGGRVGPTGPEGNGLSPVRYGTVIVE